MPWLEKKSLGLFCYSEDKDLGLGLLSLVYSISDHRENPHSFVLLFPAFRII